MTFFDFNSWFPCIKYVARRSGALLAIVLLANANSTHALELHVTAFGPEAPLFSEEGRMYVGDQLAQFDISEEGEIVPNRARQKFELQQTEGRDFFLRGEVYLAGTVREMAFPEDYLGGFTLFVRETRGSQRYELNPVRIRNKRRVLEGESISGIEHVHHFKEVTLMEWQPFSALVTADRIVFQIGAETGVIPGPVDTDGKNYVGIAPGSKLRGLWLSFVEEVEEDEPPQPWNELDIRTWTDRRGRALQAELLEFDESSVTVRRSFDGRVFTLPLDDLSPEDQQFVLGTISIDSPDTDTVGDEQPPDSIEGDQ